MTFTLDIAKRDERGKKAAKLRAEGKLPAVVYGPKEESTAVTLDRIAFEKTYREAGASSILVLSGLEEDKEVLVQDVDYDTVKGGVIHVDFYAIERGKELTTNVPLEFVGEASAVKQGGVLTKVLHEVEVTCRPSDLPHHIEVDVSSLDDFESAIHVSDLKVGSGVTITNEGDEMVALVQEVEEYTEEEPQEIDMDAIAVEEKGKSEDAAGNTEDTEKQ